MKDHNQIQENNKRQGGLRANFIIGENPAKNYTILVKDLEDYASENNIPLVEVLRYMIKDLENFWKRGYDRKLKEFTFKNINQKLIKELIKYIKRVKNNCEKKSRQDKESKDKETINNTWNEIEKEIDEAVLGGKSEQM